MRHRHGDPDLNAPGPRRSSAFGGAPAQTDANRHREEAAIAGLKGDLRMVLDATPTAAVPDELLAQLKRYQSAGNELGIWLLGASDFPELYLRSRGLDDDMGFKLRLPDVLAGIVGDSSTRRLASDLLAIIDGPTGMLGAVVAMQQAILMRLDMMVAVVGGRIA